jgi:hypothetical protein
MYKRFKKEEEARLFLRNNPRAKLVSYPEWWSPLATEWLVYVPVNGSV